MPENDTFLNRFLRVSPAADRKKEVLGRTHYRRRGWQMTAKRKQEKESILRINSDNPFCEKICNKIFNKKL